MTLSHHVEAQIPLTPYPLTASSQT